MSPGLKILRPPGDLAQSFVVTEVITELTVVHGTLRVESDSAHRKRPEKGPPPTPKTAGQLLAAAVLSRRLRLVCAVVTRKGVVLASPVTSW